ncbi:alpha/beta fold hydrolase [Priestia aryabhattai]|uniref:alpha/beta fold hydrolase n=1 Tax=Priestia aryabhattai TaxID=412384 RepID=UPI001CFC9EA6|nr:alpha/beta hydrolase [Priestia aryabhattai]
MKRNQTITLHDNRIIGYSIYGDENGIPLFLFHGTPGSRIWFLENDELAFKLGICLIAIDRPGYGLSDEKKGRKIIDFVEDLKEFSKKLNVDHFTILGVSGGAAYAAACAYALPTRVKAVAMVSSATPFPSGIPPRNMTFKNKIVFLLSKYFPMFLHYLSYLEKNILDKNPNKYKRLLQKNIVHLSDWDKEVLTNKHVVETNILHIQEAYRRGVKEVVYETQLLTKPWGFNLKEIEVPIDLYHGEDDTLSPLNEVRKMVVELSSCKPYFIPKGGHFLMENKNIWEKILKNLKVHHEN